MDSWIDFGRGPLFRLAFSLMVLGMLRLLLLTILNLTSAYRRSSDRIVPWKDIARQTLGWMVPIDRLWRGRPVYSSISLLFHVGLILVPPFLASHILLWLRATGLAWPAIPQEFADWLTLLTIACGVALLLGRLFHSAARALSRLQDYAWPLLLIIPFATGYVCSHSALGPASYKSWMCFHVYSANLVMVLLPFTKTAHCVLAPFSQLVTAFSWKFVPGAGNRVAATLNQEEARVR